jgi:sortase B
MLIKENKNNNNFRKKVMVLIIIICFVVFIYSGYNVINWYKENKQVDNITNNLLDNVDINEVEDNEDTEIVSEDVDSSNPYWDYIKMNMLDVDFNELKEINNDVVGWVEVGGTNVNYPFVQTSDNDFYLTHTLDKSSNGAGWVFMDYRNKNDEINKNMILYAHGRANGTLFGSLRKITTNGWLEDSSNFYIKIAMPNSLMIYQVFSVYVIPTTNDYIKTSFSSDEDYLSFLEMLKNRSAYDFGISVNSDDKILTLSTCYDNYKKSVLHAKLIKYQDNN